eukprot:TRINITY_DN16982_c0_g1_i1.p1 TRINITY_DN16982_c0_g1~~TRINITY_DN16982_c0_g1_i1.p1  ORF type:complete len:151 (+),score=36.74 TRINITY_DN16982_c0_g1_i1:94-546(+)
MPPKTWKDSFQKLHPNSKMVLMASLWNECSVDERGLTMRRLGQLLREKADEVSGGPDYALSLADALELAGGSLLQPLDLEAYPPVGKRLIKFREVWTEQFSRLDDVGKVDKFEAMWELCQAAEKNLCLAGFVNIGKSHSQNKTEKAVHGP